MSDGAYILPHEGRAFEMQERWLKCSDHARHFAAMNLGRFPAGTLPHTIAEAYDKDAMATQIEATEELPCTGS